MGDVKFYVQVVGGPPCEKVQLENSIVVGSEVINGLQVQHPHLSGEHCTLSLQSGVLSIIDHNSDLGVVINGKKIPPNKMIIILPTDEIKLGELQLKIYSFEEESLSEDQKTKILSLDDLEKQQQAEDIINQLVVTKGDDTKIKDIPIKTVNQSIDLNIDEKDNTDWIQLEKKVESAAPAPKATTVEENKLREPEKQVEATQTNIKQDAADPLAKFKRGAKIHEKTSKLNVDVVGQSKKNLQKYKNNSKKYYFSQFDSISFPLRIFALTLDLVLGFRLSLYLMDKGLIELFQPIDEFIQFSFDFVLNLHPDTAKYSESVVTLSPYLVGFLILRIFGNLIFGVSIGQLLIGCWADGNFAIKRILGPIRELLGFVLAPLLLFDLPAVFSKKTVKEMLTMTGLECYSKTLSYVLAIILIPTSIALSFFAPLIFEEDLKNITITVQSQVLKIPSEINSVPLTNSNFLKLESTWNNPLFMSYTNFKLIKKDNSRIYVPKVTVVSKSPGSEIIRIERKKVFDWKEHVDELVKMYPTLGHRFQNISNKNFTTELKQIIEDSFLLNQDNLANFVLNYGPYLDPFINFRRKVLSVFHNSVESVEFWKNAHSEFMVVATKSSDVAGKWRDLYIIPIGSERAYVYQISYLKDRLAKSKLLMKNFLSVANLNFKIPNAMHNWKAAELNTAEVLDYYSLKTLTLQEKAVMSSFLYRYYWNLGKMAASTEFDLFWADYVNVLQQVVLMLADLNAIDRKTQNPSNDPLTDIGYDHLIKKMSELREAVKNRQNNFFQTLKYP